MESGVLWLWGPVVAGETGPGATEMARFFIPVGAGAAAGDPAPGDSTDCRGDGPDMMKSTGNRCCVVVAGSVSIGRSVGPNRVGVPNGKSQQSNAIDVIAVITSLLFI